MMDKLLALLLWFGAVSALHLQDSRINATVKNVLNAACPGLPILFITNPQAPRWVYGELHPAAYNRMIEDSRQNSKVVKCPPQAPYSIGIECINCRKSQIFNLQTKICEDVPPSFIYDQVERKYIPAPGNPTDLVPVINQTIIPPVEPLPSIVPPVAPPIPLPTPTKEQYFTDLSHPNLLSNGRPFSQIQQQLRHRIQSTPPELKRICPSDRPFFNGSTCIDCPPQRPLFNLQSLSCTECSKGTVFSKEKHKCDIAVIKYLTSPNAANIQYGSESQQNYRNRYEIERQTFPTCPQNTPFFDGERCISCNPQYPIFNLELSRCVACPPTKVFSKEKNRCVTRTDVFPTLQRYLMNIR